MMLQFKSHILLVFAILGLCGCAQKPTTPPVSAALEGAQRLERRAVTAYNKGDLLGAQKDYQTAAEVYRSIALAEPLDVVQLNLAKLDGESDRAKEGLALVVSVLETSKVNSTRLMAYGRAAALSLALQKTAEAAVYLEGADALCAKSCTAASALASLRSEIHLLGGKPDTAWLASQDALQSATTQADKANALRSQAKIGLASMSPAQGGVSLDAAIVQAQQALQIDQTLGASARVIADLALLQALHTKAGQSKEADSYARLLTSAKAAREQLRLK